MLTGVMETVQVFSAQDGRAYEAVIQEADLFSGFLNVVVLAEEDDTTAYMMCDADVRAKVSEYRMILHALGQDAIRTPPVHPSVEWAGETQGNYNVLFSLWDNLREEYEYRFGAGPSTARLSKPRLRYPENSSWVPPPQCVPVEYRSYGQVRMIHNVIKANRSVYIHEKINARWSQRQPPEWFSSGTSRFEAELASAGVARFDQNEWIKCEMLKKSQFFSGAIA